MDLLNEAIKKYGPTGFKQVGKCVPTRTIRQIYAKMEQIYKQETRKKHNIVKTSKPKAPKKAKAVVGTKRLHQEAFIELPAEVQ